MALLSEAKRKEFFKYLGLGEYNEKNIRALQKQYLRPKDVDGKYGKNTDTLLKHLYNVKKYTKADNFKPEEFKCECGGRYCTGYPDYMKQCQLEHLQRIRTYYKKPMIITSGLRCPGYNKSIGGSIQNSLHLQGLATDFYMLGVTDTLANRKKSLSWIKKQPNHNYSYGNGINSLGAYVSAPYMGNALHTDTKPGSTPSGKLVVDGVGGTATVKAMQKFFDTTQDGVITGQNSALKKYYPSLKSVSYEGGGSAVIKKLQKWVGVTQDGILGQATVKAWQKKIGVTADGVFGMGSMKTWQTYLNNHDKPDYPPSPTPAKSTKVIDVSNFQNDINWTKVKADGIKGVIVKCGFRGAGSGKLNADSMFLKHIKGAHAAGLAVGIYMFTEAINEKEGREEADYAIKQWESAGVPIYFPIAVDTENVFYEENGKVVAGRANDTKLSKAKRTAAIKAFCEQIKAKGYKPMIYASLSWLNNQLDMSKLPYDVWVAQYNSTCDYKGKYIIWQYSSSRKVAGISSKVDMNHCYIEPKRVDPPKKITDPLQKWYDAMKTQYEWSKDQKYEWVKPTIESSKKEGTCITFPAVSLQRLGMLPSGGYFYFYPETKKIFVKPHGWIDEHKDWFDVSYPNKTVKELGDKLKKGDIVGYDNPNYHTMVYIGKNSKGDPIFNTMGNNRGLGITYSFYANRKISMIVRLKKIPNDSGTSKGYTGKFPAYRLVKSNAKVKEDTCKWARWIAGYNIFHYGHGEHAHHNGCFFCKTQKLKMNHGIVEPEYTYCCNPFVGAAFAHGGGDATAYKMCHSCDSWDFNMGSGSYEKSKLFDKLGKPAKSKLQAGDVLCNSHHVALYIGDGKIAEAGHEDNNVINSKSWNSSIEITSLDYSSFDRVYRYNGSVNADRPLMHGEVSDRVADLQRFLVWYGYLITVDGIFGQGTLDAVKKFQKAEGLTVDGSVGEATIAKMKTIKK